MLKSVLETGLKVCLSLIMLELSMEMSSLVVKDAMLDAAGIINDDDGDDDNNVDADAEEDKIVNGIGKSGGFSKNIT
jgi:hypothetical protein